jgi:hypothetical protein
MRRPFPEIPPGAFALVLSTVVATVLLANADLDQRLSLVTPGSHFYIVSADDDGEAGDDENEGGGAWTGAFDRLGEAALLHDVGKIGVPDAMLHKSGPLDDEFRVIQMHPVRGDDILGSSNGAGIGRAVVRHHHEKVDGRGYSDDLAGEDILLEARITDVHDALRSARSYRTA